MPGNDDLTLLVKRAEALAAFLKTDDGENLLQGFKRATNILTQAEEKDGVEYSYGADVKFAETDAERALFAALDTAEAAITPAMKAEDFAAAMSAMAALRAPIDAFFEAVQVNTDNEVMRRNRLNLLQPHPHDLPERGRSDPIWTAEPKPLSNESDTPPTLRLRWGASGVFCMLNTKGAAVQHNDPDLTLITPSAPIKATTHGGRAKCLQRLVRLDLPVPLTVALSSTRCSGIAAGEMPDMAALLDAFGDTPLLCVRPSSEDPDWGGPGAILNIGMNDAGLCRPQRASWARMRRRRSICASCRAYAMHVARLDPDMFDDVTLDGPEGLAEVLRAYEDETEEAFPQDPAVQLAEVLRSMARAWEGTTARLLRQAKGAPADAGLGLVVQEMALGLGQGECGSGVIQLVELARPGSRRSPGATCRKARGAMRCNGAPTRSIWNATARGPSLEELAPDAFDELKAHTALMRQRLREEMQIEFTIENGQVHILDGVRVAAQCARGRAHRRGAGRRRHHLPRRGADADRAARAQRTAAPPDRPRRAARRAGPWHRRQPRCGHRHGSCSPPPRRRPVPRGASPASWCAAKPRPRIFAACMPPSPC